MTKRKLKDYMTEQEEIIKESSDKEVFEDLKLSDKEKNILRCTVLKEEISIPALVDLILNIKANKNIKDENIEELELRGYIDKDGYVTEQANMFLDLETTKQRIKKLLDE